MWGCPVRGPLGRLGIGGLKWIEPGLEHCGERIRKPGESPSPRWQVALEKVRVQDGWEDPVPSLHVGFAGRVLGSQRPCFLHPALGLVQIFSPPSHRTWDGVEVALGDS